MLLSLTQTVSMLLAIKATQRNTSAHSRKRKNKIDQNLMTIFSGIFDEYTALGGNHYAHEIYERYKEGKENDFK